MNHTLAAATVVAALAAGVALAQDKKPDRETKVRADKENVEKAGAWIYDDLPRGVEEAKKSGKPLLVVFRCIPCEACAKIDEDVVDRDPIVAKLLDQFVCVRIPHANGMDLSVFQFDYDQSWAAFMMNADMTIYGRYGTRSDRTHSENDVSLEGFAKALEGALKVHATLPDEAYRLLNKRSKPLEVGRPEEFPSFEGKYGASLDYAKDKKVVPTCMHCHQLGEAQRRFYRDSGNRIPERLVFPYPNPRVLGLVMDPKGKARIQSVVAGSRAEQDGFRAGDELDSLGGEPMLSIADIQWKLHNMPDMWKEPAYVVRNGEDVHLTMTFVSGWRRGDDISWRASSWGLRRMTTGGMLLEALPAEERAKLSIKDGAMALVAKYVPQNGEHAAAKNAGFQKGDVVVSVDGRTDVMTETQWLTGLVNAKKPGEKIPVVVLRDGKKLELTLPMQ